VQMDRLVDDPHLKRTFKEDRLYSPTEVAQILRVSRVTVTRSIKLGRLQAMRVGSQWRVLGSEVLKYLERETSRALGQRRKVALNKMKV
jgi:excisionase family DNA binding protein